MVLLFLLVIVPYAQVLRHDFVRFDDFDYIVNNPVVNGGLSWEGVREAFSGFHQANWHPVTWLSHMADVELFGMNAGAHHMVSVLLHATSSIVLFAALLLMTRSFWPSLASAALFAVHPLHVESVAWASERKDILATLFWMLTILAYAKYARRPGLPGYLAVFALMALGLMSKPMLVTLPCVLLLLDVWPLQRFEPFRGGSSARLRPLILEKIPLFALSASSVAVTMLAQGGGGAVQDLARMPLAWRGANALVAYVTYLGKAVWPSGLAFYYPHPAIIAPDTLIRFLVPAGAAGAFLVIATVLMVRHSGRRPYLAVGWLWYLGTLFPVVGIVQVGNQAWADRYAYVPLVGIYILATWTLAEFGRTRKWFRIVAAASLVVCLPVLAAVTRTQASHWKSSRTLFQRALNVTSNNYVAHNNLGNLLLREGDLPGAKLHLEAALVIRPDLPEAHNSLGSVLSRDGDLLGAEFHFRRAVELDPDYFNAWFNLGLNHQRRGECATAVEHYRRALAIRPGQVQAEHQLAELLASCGGEIEP